MSGEKKSVLGKYVLIWIHTDHIYVLEHVSFHRTASSFYEMLMFVL